MILMKKFIDLSLIDNQMIVAKDWIIYRERIIISEDLRYQIESYLDTYNEGMITGMELYSMILEGINMEVNSRKN